MMCKRLMAEAIGSFWLVFVGCGAAAMAGQGLGTLGVSLAFGLALTAMAYAIGPVSGCHLNPAVTVGLTAGGRFPMKEVPGYVIVQVLGALLAAWVLSQIAGGIDNAKGMGLGANGFAEHSPGGYSMHAALLAEIVLSGLFLFIIMGTTDGKNGAHAPLAIGVAFAVIYMVAMPVTGASINPGALDRAGDHHGRLGAVAALAVLGRAAHRRGHRRRRLPEALRVQGLALA